MTDTDSAAFQRNFLTWLRTFLSDRQYTLARCGSQTELGEAKNHHVDPSTGDWANKKFSNTKPPRWLYWIIPEQGKLRAESPPARNSIIAAPNTSQEKVAATTVRILPIVRANTRTIIAEDLEVWALFVFGTSAPKGTSSETLSFDQKTGILTYKSQPLPYTLAGLLGIQRPDYEVQLGAMNGNSSLQYSQVLQALSKDIMSHPIGADAKPIDTYDLTDDSDFERLRISIQDSWNNATSTDSRTVDDLPDISEVTPPSELIGINESVYRQINAAIKSEKKHIMLYGPPGTGKTTLARWIAADLAGSKWKLVTGSADWTSQDIIGGYQPMSEGSISFIPGILLRNFDRPLIIDELNRCDIDKVLGPLFTVLSGQHTTLPYRFDIADENSDQYVILPEPKEEAPPNEFAPSPMWRLITTINSVDKAALYQISYALSRRFCWIYVDVPSDKTAFIIEYLRKHRPSMESPSAAVPCPLGAFWEMVCSIRVLGPAPFIDAIKIILSLDDNADFFDENVSDTMRQGLLDALDMVILPMLDGIPSHEANRITEHCVSDWKLDKYDELRIADRINYIAV